MRLRHFESSPSIVMGPPPQVSTNSNTQKERTMRRLSIAFALSTLLLVTICSAQQPAQNTSASPAQREPVLIPYIYGNGTTNYIGMFDGLSGDGHYQMGQSPMAVTTDCVGFSGTCITAPDPLQVGGVDVEGSTAYYEIYGSPVLSIGSSSSDENLFVGVNAGINNNVGANNTFEATGLAIPIRRAGQHVLGFQAGNSNTTGSSNTYVGDQAGVNNVRVRSNTLPRVRRRSRIQTSESNTLRLGAAAQTNFTYIAGISGHIGRYPVAWRCSSSYRNGQLGTYDFLSAL